MFITSVSGLWTIFKLAPHIRLTDQRQRSVSELGKENSPHNVCPYSRATRGNIDVTINMNRRRFTVSEDAAGRTPSIVKQAQAQLAPTGLELPPTAGHEPKFVGRIGKELNAGQDRSAAYAAVLNVLAVARHHLGSLDKISRVVSFPLG